MIACDQLTQMTLKEMLDYDPETGIFTRKAQTSQRIKVGQVAGTDSHGYIRIRLFAIKHSAHRLAWLYMYGEFPNACIDHINGNPGDNRIANLRLATHAENMRNFGMKSNNTSGFKGVTWHSKTGKWRATCRVNGKSNSLGLYQSKEEASAAFIEFSKRQFGDFFNSSGVKK